MYERNVLRARPCMLMRVYIFHRAATLRDNVMKLIVNHKRGNKKAGKATMQTTSLGR